MRKCVVIGRHSYVKNVPDANIWKKMNRVREQKLDRLVNDIVRNMSHEIAQFVETHLTKHITAIARPLDELMDGQWHQVTSGAGQTHVRYDASGKWHVRRTTASGDTGIVEGNYLDKMNAPHIVALSILEKDLKQLIANAVIKKLGEEYYK